MKEVLPWKVAPVDGARCHSADARADSRTSAAHVSAASRSMARTSASARESEEERRKDGPGDVARAKLVRRAEAAAVGEENEREMPVRQFHHERRVGIRHQ